MRFTPNSRILLHPRSESALQRRDLPSLELRPGIHHLLPRSQRPRQTRTLREPQQSPKLLHETTSLQQWGFRARWESRTREELGRAIDFCLLS